MGAGQGGDNDPELLLRWLQFGAFTPIFRTHATNDSKLERRIWKYSNFTQLREAVRERYRLFPYLYTAARETYDTGVGMNEEQLNQCTEPFYTTKKKGTGMGLALAKQFIKENDGRLEIESREGVGTSVRMTAFS